MSKKDYPELPLGFEDLLAAFPDAVVVHDMENRVLYWNRRAEALYGWSAGEILGRPIGRLFYLEPRQRKAAIEILRNAGTWSGELRQLDREGREYRVDVRQQLHRDEDGTARAVISINRDVTPRKKASGAVAHRCRLQSSSLLAGNIAHELNNALAPIMLSSAMLKRMVEGGKPQKMIEIIEKCAAKSAGLVSDLLAFERGKGGGGKVIPKSRILRGIRQAREAVVPDEVEFNVSLASDLWEVHGEEKELTEAFQHIMRNASEAMPGGGSLSIEVANCFSHEDSADPMPEAEVDTYVRIAFKDTGFGIDEKIIGRVVEPLFTTKEPREAFGFGLSNSQAIIKGHRGFMVLESRLGRGTTLNLYLPANAEQRGEDASTAATEGCLVAAGRRLVLVADDEQYIRETIERTLEDQGYRVLTARDGAEALEVYAAKQEEIDLVLTNMEMPFLDGLALCRALKKLNPGVRILASSGHQQEDKRREIKSSGVDQFLAKPYTAEQLMKCVGETIAGGGS